MLMGSHVRQVWWGPGRPAVLNMGSPLLRSRHLSHHDTSLKSSARLPCCLDAAQKQENMTRAKNCGKVDWERADLCFCFSSGSSIRAAIRWDAKEILKRDRNSGIPQFFFNPVAHNPSMKCSNQFQTLKWSWCLLQLHLSLSYNQHESDRRNKEVKSESWDQKRLVPKCIPHCTGWGEAASCQQLCQLF